MVTEELVADAVELVGGHAGDGVFADLLQGLRRDTSGDPHPFDGLRGLDVAVAPLGFGLPHVLRPDDMGGDLEGGRDTPWAEQRRHADKSSSAARGHD
ncbi:hypothetical protein Mth01_31440 [Sphaerimonospora thailandensis]|uniref:Uncharacterized protein n=1 Tax=Sphaerimonospora thailandensis TaxID=795644 RepID=A0A8J3W0L5_9ACTN|nr:hypothetical protein Mth01_31440 [Sphaerimonospora thailandensis]